MAMGAITGAMVADARRQSSPNWTQTSLTAVAHAESLLSGHPLPIDLPPQEAVPAAVGSATAGPPLLADGATIALFETIRGALDGDAVVASDPTVAKAIVIASSLPFIEAVDSANDELAVLVGAMSGLSGGIGSIPARLASTTVAPDGRQGRRYLSGLTLRLLGIERPLWYDPRRRRGPKEVLPGLWLSNLYGVTRFMEIHPTGVVLSLCDDEGRVDGHPGEHLTFHLEDAPNSDANPNLVVVLDDVLREIAEARSSGRPVLLHCRHGASRTGLVLRLILIDELGLDAEAALMEAQCIWPHTSTWNKAWNREVERRANPWKPHGGV